MEILFALLIFVVVVYLAFWILGQMQLPQPIRMVGTIIIGLIALMVLWQMFGGGFGDYSVWHSHSVRVRVPD